MIKPQLRVSTMTTLTISMSLVLATASPSLVAKEKTRISYQGECATLPASRSTEFHGNPQHAELLLAMAGNQWVVFDEALRRFNETRGLNSTIPVHQASYTLDELRDASRSDYYVQLIPPGTLRDQIKSGCLLLGNVDENDPERNFLPLNIQVEFDVFASTNYNLMRDLAAHGFVSEAKPYIKNKLDLLVTEGNPHRIGIPGTNNSGLADTGNDSYDRVFDVVMDLLDPTVPVSQVDHINEGIHRGINAMYQRMDQYLRDQDPSPDGIYASALDKALATVATPQLPDSPGHVRPQEEDISTNFTLSENSNCHYTEGPYAGKLRFCEFAVLNKNNTHETRVHHVETPERVRNGNVFTGPLWITEVVYAQNSPNPVAVEGVNIAGFDPDEVVNQPVSYSIAILNNARNKKLANDFVHWIRSPAGQQVYTSGGFIGLSAEELAAGECYDGAGNTQARVNNRCK